MNALLFKVWNKPNLHTYCTKSYRVRFQHFALFSYRNNGQCLKRLNLKGILVSCLLGT